MDIYTAQSAADRLLKFAEKAASSESGLYSKSVDRYAKLVETCTSAIEILQQLLPVPEEPVEAMAEDVTANTPPLVFPKKKHSRQQVISCYSDVLKHIAAQRSGYHEVDQFTSVLSKWYQARFCSGKEFTCNTRMLGDWILKLAVHFGNCLESNRSYADTMLHEMSNYADDLVSGFISSQYILPKELYASLKSVTGATTSLTGAVLWDMLYDLGLNCLHPEQSDSYEPADAAKMLYDDRPDDVPHYYRNYKDSPMTLKRTKLTSYLEKEDNS